MTGPVVIRRFETMERKEASHFWGKHNSLPATSLCSLPLSRNVENAMAAYIFQTHSIIFYGAGVPTKHATN